MRLEQIIPWKRIGKQNNKCKAKQGVWGNAPNKKYASKQQQQRIEQRVPPLPINFLEDQDEAYQDGDSIKHNHASAATNDTIAIGDGCLSTPFEFEFEFEFDEEQKKGDGDVQKQQQQQQQQQQYNNDDKQDIIIVLPQQQQKPLQ